LTASVILKDWNIPMSKTIRTGLRSILRPNFQHLLPVFREMAVTASFLRRQGLLLLNLYMNKPGKYLYFSVCMSSILSTNLYSIHE
jgi:hypothetical protein